MFPFFFAVAENHKESVLATLIHSHDIINKLIIIMNISTPILLLPKDKLMMLHTATIRSIQCDLTAAVDIEPTLVTRIIRNYGMGVPCFANYGAPSLHHKTIISLPSSNRLSSRLGSCTQSAESRIARPLQSCTQDHLRIARDKLSS